MLIVLAFTSSLLAAQPATTQSISQLPMVATTTRLVRCENSIDSATKFLLSRQRANGCWADLQSNDPQGGQTALVTLALLSAGVSHQSDAIVRSVAYLHSLKPNQTYGVALRACVYAQLPNAQHSPELRADVAALQKLMIQKAPNPGMFTYGKPDFDNSGDYSNSQYGVLGVWYAAETGIEVPLHFWHQAEDAWHAGQQRDGGWGYLQINDNQSYASMTAAAAATLFITNDYLHTNDSVDLLHHTNNEALDKAIAWLGSHFAADRNVGRDPPSRDDPNDPVAMFGRMRMRPGFEVPYMLFGYERVGEASGLTRFGMHRWFDEGTDFLCGTQYENGSWSADGSMSGSKEVVTAYALLFLSRGRSPVAIQKLDFGTRWNNRPRDLANFINYLRYNTETHLNWQLVDASAAASDLREAPILYAASDRPIVLTESQKQNLKNYILHGGLLFTVNEGESTAYDRSIEALGEELFPDQKFHSVALNDPMIKGNFRGSGPTMPTESLGNGIRDFIVLTKGGDLSWKWEVAGGAQTAHLNPYTTCANLWSESIGSGDPMLKGESTWFDRLVSVPDSPRNIHVARVQFGGNGDGNWDPEPAGWERLANLLHNAGDAEVQVEPRPLADLSPADNIAHLTATGDVVLKPAEVTALRKFIDGGGLFVFDAAGGSAQASISMQAILSGLYPAAQNDPLPIDHPIYRGLFPGGRPIDSVTYRQSEQLPSTHLPRLRGLTLNGKLLAVISLEDISSALVGYPRANMPGYTPQSAAELMRAILLWRSGTRS